VLLFLVTSLGVHAAPGAPERVFIVDDHLAILRQVGQLPAGEFKVVDTLEGGPRLEAAIAESRPDLIVPDLPISTPSHTK
jgi:hypothetical protein